MNGFPIAGMSKTVAHVMSDLDVRKEKLVVQFTYHRELEHSSGILGIFRAKYMSVNVRYVSILVYRFLLMASSLKSVINMFAKKQELKVLHFDLLAAHFPEV